jgi:hypothetical protein
MAVDSSSSAASAGRAVSLARTTSPATSAKSRSAADDARRFLDLGPADDPRPLRASRIAARKVASGERSAASDVAAVFV